MKTLKELLNAELLKYFQSVDDIIKASFSQESLNEPAINIIYKPPFLFETATHFFVNANLDLHVYILGIQKTNMYNHE